MNVTEIFVKNIDTALKQDNGAKWKSLIRKYMLQANAVFSNEGSDRNYLGASQIGISCEKQLYYTLIAPKRITDGRLIRLLHRGHMEEPRILAMFELLGFDVRQDNCNFVDGEFAGTADGVIAGATLLEMKTSNAANFNKLVKKGVKETKPVHYAQMQVYMHKLKLRDAFYFVVNKDNDDINVEAVSYNEGEAEVYVNKAHKIILATKRKEVASLKADFSLCSMCNYRKECYNDIHV